MEKFKKLLRKAFSIALCAALVGGTALTLPALTQDSVITVSAATTVKTASTLEEFLTVVNNANDGDTIKLTGSFTVVGKCEINANNESKTLTVDFNGNTIHFDGKPESQNKIQSYLYINNANLYLIFKDSGSGGGMVADKERIVRLLMIEKGKVELLSGIYTGGLDVTRTNTSQAYVYVKGGYYDLLDEDYDGPFFKLSSSSTFEVSGGYYTERSRVDSVAPGLLNGYEIYDTGFEDYAKGVRIINDAKSLSNVTIADISDKKYTGNKITPALTVKDGSVTLAENVDYTVSYSNNIKVGTATASVIGIGNYYGTLTKEFNIVKATPKYTKPTGLTATYGQKLNEVKLPDGWTWDNPDQSVGSAGTNTFKATFTPKDTANYKTVSGISVSVTVGHLITFVESKDATCTADGNIAYWQDENGQIYSDAEGKTVMEDSVVIPATGHSYGKPKWTWAKDYSSASAYFTCTKGDDKQKVTAKVTSKKTEATCKDDGKTVYTATVKFSGKTYKSTKTVVIPKNPDAHKYEETVVSPTATEQGYTLHTCTVCGDSYKDNYVNPLLVNNSTITTTAEVGDPVVLNARAAGGTGEYTYALKYKKSTSSTWKTIGTNYGTQSTGSFTPKSAGTYNIAIKVKDSSGKIKTKTFTVNIKAPLKNKTTIDIGEKILLKGAASGGASGYTYAFYYKRSTNSTWKEIKPAYTTDSAEFTPASSTSYDIRSIVKDADGVMSEKTFTVKVIK